MSRVGRSPIAVPSNVTVTLSGATVSVKGPQGTLERQLPEGITVAQEGDQWHVHGEDAHLAFLPGKRDHVHVLGIDLAGGSGDFEFQAGCHGVVVV